MNRTTATCIAGMRSKTTRRIKIHFHRLRRPREAEPFTRTRSFFVFVFGIFAKRLRWRPERNRCLSLAFHQSRRDLPKISRLACHRSPDLTKDSRRLMILACRDLKTDPSGSPRHAQVCLIRLRRLQKIAPPVHHEAI